MAQYTTYLDIGEPTTLKQAITALIKGTGFLRDNGMFKDMVELIDQSVPPYLSISVRDLRVRKHEVAREYALRNFGFDPTVSIVMYAMRGFSDPEGQRKSLTLMARTLNTVVRELKGDILGAVEPSSLFSDFFLRKGNEEILMNPDPQSEGMWDAAAADFSYRPHVFPS